MMLPARLLLLRLPRNQFWRGLTETPRAAAIPRVDPASAVDDPSLQPDATAAAANVHLVNQLRHRRLGPVYIEQIGPDVEVVFVAEPKLCKQVFQAEGPHPKHLVPRAWEVYNEKNKVKRGLFFMDGKEWANMRTKLNRLFFAKETANNDFPEHIYEASNMLLQSMLSDSNNDNIRLFNDIEDSLSLWSVKSMLSYLFGSGYVQNDSISCALVSSVQGIFEASAELQFVSAEDEARMDTELWRRFSGEVTKAMELARSLTEQKPEAYSGDGSGGLMEEMKRMFTPEEVTSIVVDLIIAAADTTSTTALWTLHLLSSNQQQQDAVLREGREYSIWCIREAMRMFPVAPFITRILPADLKLDGYEVIPAGQLVLLSTYTMGRDADNFPLADSFWPRRFMRLHHHHPVAADAAAAIAAAGGAAVSARSLLLGVRDLNSLLPFGFGARGCIGRRIAMEQLTHLVTKLIQLFRLQNMNEKTVQMTMRFTGVPDQKIMIGYSPRKRGKSPVEI